jgi:Domain of unknown function (DUF1877)
MGIEAFYKPISEAVLALLRDKSDLSEIFVCALPHGFQHLPREFQKEMRAKFADQHLEFRNDLRAALGEDFSILAPALASPAFTLDKMWPEVQELLPYDLHASVSGGTEFGDSLGYGPARFFTAQEVSEIAIALSSFLDAAPPNNSIEGRWLTQFAQVYKQAAAEELAMLLYFS